MLSLYLEPKFMSCLLYASEWELEVHLKNLGTILKQKQKTVHLCIIPSALALLWLLPQLSVFLLSSGPDIYVPEDHKLEWKAYIETIQILLIMRKNYF